MDNHKSCSIDDKRKAEEILQKIKDDPKIQDVMEDIKTKLDNMPCARNPQTGGGFTLTTEQQLTAVAWAGRLFAAFKLTMYVYNIVDASSFQCATPHWVAGYFGLGDEGYCASKSAILQETITHLTKLLITWAASESLKKAVTPSGGKRKSKRKTRKSKKTRKGKKGKKGRKSRRKH